VGGEVTRYSQKKVMRKKRDEIHTLLEAPPQKELKKGKSANEYSTKKKRGGFVTQKLPPDELEARKSDSPKWM